MIKIASKEFQVENSVCQNCIYEKGDIVAIDICNKIIRLCPKCREALKEVLSEIDNKA